MEVVLVVMETKETEFVRMVSAARNGAGVELRQLIAVGVGLSQSSVIGLCVPPVLSAVTDVAAANTLVAT